MITISATKPGFRGGRPNLKKEDVRKPYNVRLSASERQQVRERAEEPWLDFSTYCRHAKLNPGARRTVPAINGPGRALGGAA